MLDNTNEGRCPFEIIQNMCDKQMSAFLGLIIDISRENMEMSEVEVLTYALLHSEDYENMFEEESD